MSQATSGSSSATQTDAERAISALMPLAAEFRARFVKAMQGRETGHVSLRINYDRGRVTFMGWKAEDSRNITVGKLQPPNPLDD